MAQRGSRVAPTLSNDSRTSLIGSGAHNKPLGIRLFGHFYQFPSASAKRTYYKALVLFLTFIAYTAFHMGRRPLSVVKNKLNHGNSAHSSLGPMDGVELAASNASQDANWAPFDNDATANQLLAVLDSAFLAAYALFMFFSGMLAERANLRYFISAGSVLSGFGLIAFGLAYPLNIHSLPYFVAVQIFSGAVQSTGWPVVVTCVGNWFEPAKRGLIYGLWNSHTNFGNILGATIAGFFVEKDWGLSFIVPGVIMIVVGIILFLFLVPTPRDVELSAVGEELEPQMLSSSVSTLSSNNSRLSVEPKSNQDGLIPASSISTSHSNHEAVSFWTAMKIPGVMEYAMCLFFSKLVNYTFLYWLPRYITASTNNNSEHSAYLSTPFDIGGAAGAILAGYLSDKYGANGVTCNIMLLMAIPAMFAYQQYGALSSANNILLQLLVGSLVNGPYCLITTSVSADLGNRIKDGRAMATVAAIIDGMGSIGAVLGPLFAGLVSSSGNWQQVFMMLMISDVLASLCLLRLTTNELKGKFSNKPETTETIRGGQLP